MPSHAAHDKTTMVVAIRLAMSVLQSCDVDAMLASLEHAKGLLASGRCEEAVQGLEEARHAWRTVDNAIERAFAASSGEFSKSEIVEVDVWEGVGYELGAMLSRAHLAAGQFGEAVSVGRETVAYMRARGGCDDSCDAAILSTMAEAERFLARNGDMTTALDLCAEALSLHRSGRGGAGSWDARLGPPNPREIETVFLMGKLLMGQGDFESAQGWFRDARRMGRACGWRGCDIEAREVNSGISLCQEFIDRGVSASFDGAHFRVDTRAVDNRDGGGDGGADDCDDEDLGEEEGDKADDDDLIRQALANGSL